MSGEPFHRIGDGLRRMYYESEYATVEEFLVSLECPNDPSGLAPCPACDYTDNGYCCCSCHDTEADQ